MTAARSQGQPENVLGGALLAVLALPVGVVVLALISSIGFVASIVGYLVAFSAVWLYRRGSGGVISRVGAWIVTGIVALTLLVGIWVSLVIIGLGGIGNLGAVNDPRFWTVLNADFPDLLSSNILFVVLIVVFGALGSFRVLGRAFRTAHQTANPVNLTGQTLPTAPQIFHDDIDAPPTGSADDKTAPPTAGS